MSKGGYSAPPLPSRPGFTSEAGGRGNLVKMKDYFNPQATGPKASSEEIEILKRLHRRIKPYIPDTPITLEKAPGPR